MLHDLLTALLGLEGDFIVKQLVNSDGNMEGKDDIRPSFVLAPIALSRLSDSQVLSIKPLLHIAGLYNKVADAVEAVLTSVPEPHPAPYHYTLVAIIESVVLEPYRDRICDIEGSLLQHDGLLPVTYLVAQLRDQTILLTFFSDLLDEAQSVRGCILLNLLWSRYHALPECSPIRRPLGFCLDALGELFSSMLSKWVSFGQVPMMPDVFFITPISKDYSVVETESASSSAVEIDQQLIPKGIISSSLAEKILLCGSAVRVLGLCDTTDDTNKNAENLSRLRQLNVLFDGDDPNSKMTSPGCIRYIERSVERARGFLNGWLRGTVSPTLLEHLSAVRGLYLLGDGGFWQTFLEECAELTVTRKGNVTEYDLSAGPWQLALAEHYVETSHQANLASLRLLPLGFSFASKPLFNITKQSAGAVPVIDWELACKSSLCLVGTARLGGQGAAELLRLGSSGQCWATNRQLVARGKFCSEIEFIGPENSTTSSGAKEGSMSFVVLYQHIHSPSEIVVGSAGWSSQPNGKPCDYCRTMNSSSLYFVHTLVAADPFCELFMYSAFPTSLGIEVRAVPAVLGTSNTTEFEVRVVLTNEGNRMPNVLAAGKSVSPGYRTTADDFLRTHTLTVTTGAVKIDEVLICEFRLPTTSSLVTSGSQSGWKLDGLGCCFVGICTTDSANGNSYLEICKWSHIQPSSESRGGGVGGTWLDRVVIVYELPWPLPLIIGTDEFTKYSIIFRSLLSLRHSALGLDTLWQTLTRVSRKQRQIRALPWLSHILAVRARMAAWLSTVIQYFTIDVISVRYAEMVKKVSLSTTEFDGIVRAHRAFLDDIVSKCFLESNPRSRRIRSSIDKLSRACMKLSALGKQGIFDDALPNERLSKALRSLEEKFIIGVRDLISLLDDMHLTSSERAHSLSQLLLRLDYNEVYTRPQQPPTTKLPSIEQNRMGRPIIPQSENPSRDLEQSTPVASAEGAVSAVSSHSIGPQYGRTSGPGLAASESSHYTIAYGLEPTHLEGYDSAATGGSRELEVHGATQDVVSKILKEGQDEQSKVLSAYEKSKALLESIRRRKLLRAAEEADEGPRDG